MAASTKSDALVNTLSKHQDSKWVSMLPNDFAEEDAREKDNRVVANAQILTTLGRVVTAL